MRIVIVEREAAVLEGLATIIHGTTPHSVVGKCRSGEEGLEAIQKQKPDLVITGIKLEGMDGLTMLQKLQDIGEDVIGIVVSTHTEFTYVRMALRLGVEDYLKRPVSAEQLQEALKRVENRKGAYRYKTAKQPENYLREYLWGNKEEQEEAKSRFAVIFPEERQKEYAIFAGYMGNASEEDTEEVENAIRMLKRQFPNINYLDTTEERLKLRILILKAFGKEIDAFTECCSDAMARLEQARNVEAPWAMDVCEWIEDWQDTFFGVQKALSYGLSQGCGRVMRVGRLGFMQQRELTYPIGAEKKIFTAIGETDYKAAKKQVEKFLAELAKAEYAPEDIRRAVIKLIIRMNDMADEINQKAHMILREKDYISRTLTAQTVTELRVILCEMCRIICTKEKKENINNYTINRSLEYIRMHYNEGITLEETAKVLGITPEYLSMLFKREMGMNFSVFLKKFRISHAKRLLKGTDMKIYEIAEQCGYSNSNYFTKVFKEVAGVAPAEFRA